MFFFSTTVYWIIVLTYPPNANNRRLEQRRSRIHELPPGLRDSAIYELRFGTIFLAIH